MKMKRGSDTLQFTSGPMRPMCQNTWACFEKQGLVVGRKQGPNIFYRGTIPDLVGFICALEKAVQQRLDSHRTRKTGILGAP